MLLTGLQGEPVGGVAGGVVRDTDQPTRQLALQRRAHRKEAGVRAAEAERHAEPLGGPDGDVGTHLAGRGEQGQRQQVCGDRHHGLALMAGRDEIAQVPDPAGPTGV